MKGKEVKKPHLFKCEVVCRSKKNGRLGIEELQIEMRLFCASGCNGGFQENNTLSGIPSFVVKTGLARMVGTPIRFCHLRTVDPGRYYHFSHFLFLLPLRSCWQPTVHSVLDRHLVWFLASSVSFPPVVQSSIEESKSYFRFCLRLLIGISTFLGTLKMLKLRKFLLY